MGSTTKAKGFWVAETVWVSPRAAGSAKVVGTNCKTTWTVPTLDLRIEMDNPPNFPSSVARASGFIHPRRGVEAVRRGYDICPSRWTSRPTSRQMRLSPFYPRAGTGGTIHFQCRMGATPVGSWKLQRSHCLQNHEIPPGLGGPETWSHQFRGGRAPGHAGKG